MASALVLPNLAKKQEHLEAGKRRLEEFRKKKAADRAKKVVSASHVCTATVARHDKQPLDSNGAGTSDGVSEAVVEPSLVVVDENNVIEFVENNELASYNTHANPPLQTKYYNALSTETVQAPVKNQEFDRYNASHSDGTVNVNYSAQTQENNDDFAISTGATGRTAYRIITDQSVAFHPQAETNGNSSQPSQYGLEETHLKDNESHLTDFTFGSPTSHVTVTNVSLENSGSVLLQYNNGYSRPLATGLTLSSYEDSIQPSTKITESYFQVGQNIHAVTESTNTVISDMGEKNSLSHFHSGNSTPSWPSESPSTAFSFDGRSSSSHLPLYPAVAEISTRRSRPSFLDSINMPKIPLTEPGRVESSKFSDRHAVASSAFETSFAETETIHPFSKFRDPNVASAFEHSMTSTVSARNGDDMYGHTFNENMDRRHDSYSRKQDEDFAALEQHIEDLTQEKFSLQRALEASQTLAESLASENSALTDSYNQQGSVVNQLKSEMEKLQEEIKAQLEDLESLKREYANVQLECNASDEHAKLLASEVIGLEEKALRLRSSELKLERQLENSQAEISSFKKKMSSLEKERQDLQLTIDALQEEKKLLQVKLMKASVNGKFVDVSKNPTNKKDVSTSTEDLDTTADTSNLEMHSTAGSDASSSSLLPDDGQLNIQVASLNIPPDQMRMILSINALISELSLEKEKLMQALLAESHESSNLKELNKDLSRKLETQTQRLELLTAQSMANENISTRPLDPCSMQDNTPYADEGDEVVERVLGWIMKLFPGGPSRRQTSKLL
ncbi:protein BLISTER isoform X2 [Camellia sinensis]|uniref:protein BLISTER isoform X2 n=1 Tax=Camellia sinensis TaxID=4442 RepID=UPI001035B214|nr:protein BLISTER isoform X2 [Camellia sinensis]